MKQTKKRRRSRAVFLFLIWIACIICLPGQKALAASAAVNLSLSTEEVAVGDTFWVVLTVEASEEIGNVQCYLSFDSGALRFISGGSYATGGSGLVLISDKDGEESDSASRKYSLKFKAIGAGETTVQIENDVKISCALDDAGMSISSNQLLFEITDPERISDNTALSKLLVSSGELSPKFSRKVKRYKMEVAHNINQIAVNAAPADENAMVSITGNTKLKDGKNTVTLTVTAPSGDQAVTKIVVTKKSPLSAGEETADNPQDTIAIGPTGVTAHEDEAGNRFLSEQLRLQVLPLEDESLLPANYEKTTIVIDGLPITVYTFSYDLDSDKLLVYGMNQNGETGLYQYNRAAKTLTKYEAVSGDTDGQQKTQSQADAKAPSAAASYLIAIAILAALCVILTILLVFQKIKNAKIEEKENETDYF